MGCRPATNGDQRMPVDVGGAKLFRNKLDVPAQEQLLSDIRRIVAAAPLFHPKMQNGRKMSVAMTSAGRFGWISDRRGYRYEQHHPSGVSWPDIPPSVHAIWSGVAGVDRDPECCLVNFYSGEARMGLHQDKDEADTSMPVVSVSLGDDALFRIGGTVRGSPTQSVWLSSGDVLVLGGAARMAYHGIDRVRFGSSRLLTQGGRINLTLRVVT